MTSMPLFGTLSSLYHGSLYKTQPFTKALRKHLSDQPFFGTATHRSLVTTSTKVAVTASTGLERQAVVFANYNRPDLHEKSECALTYVLLGDSLIKISGLPYRFVRSDTPSKEMRMWEA